ncbi:hypothetical protein [Streptomyces sp. R41]|uniref:Uncharacterized protein n=1 Tax=Streptomyces sp. R41 TaxID=3238632 RepID=A0AB39RP61_9ACTN
MAAAPVTASSAMAHAKVGTRPDRVVDAPKAMAAPRTTFIEGRPRRS